MLDIDPAVKQFSPQGLSVDLVQGALLFSREAYKAAKAAYHDRPGPSLYTVDFCAEFSQSAKRAIEVRLDKFPGDDVYTQKIARAKDILARHGWEFSRLLIPADETKPVWSNVALVCQVADRKDLWPTPEVLAKVDTLHRDGARSARDYLEGLELTTGHLPVLLVSGALKTDMLAAHFTFETAVEPANGDVSHLRVIERLEG